jgi:hypothetical protein
MERYTEADTRLLIGRARQTQPEELRAWVVPSGLLKDGLNSIEISLIEGEPAEIIFLDLAVK